MNCKNAKKKIFLILGDACNMKCLYCKAHLGDNNTIENKEINPKVINTLEDMVIKEPLLINFYGGEPLLYFDKIKQVVNSLSKYEDNIIWSTMTNGRSITQEMVDFFNEHKFAVNLSWDGNNSTVSRGFNVLDDAQRRKLLLQINDLWINSTITTLNYPLEITQSHIPILKEYQNIHDYSYGINLGFMTPTGTNNELCKFDYDRIYNEIQSMWIDFCKNGVTQPFSKLTPSDCVVRTTLFKFMSKTVSDKDADICIDMDIDGNLFACPFSRTPINNVSDIDLYLEFAFQNKLKRKCQRNCPINAVCDGNCPQLVNSPLFEEGCKLRRAFYSPFLETTGF